MFIAHLFSESTISLNDCSNSGSEALTCPNQMSFIDFGHSLCYSGLERLNGVTGVLIYLSLDDAPCIIVQRVVVG